MGAKSTNLSKHQLLVRGGGDCVSLDTGNNETSDLWKLAVVEVKDIRRYTAHGTWQGA